MTDGEGEPAIGSGVADEAGGVDYAERILNAAFIAVHRLAKTAWVEALPEILQVLAEATGSSRVYLFENVTLPDGRLAMNIHSEWVAPGVTSYADLPDNHDWPYDEGHERHRQILSSGGVIHGPTSEFPPDEREDMDKEDIRSTAFVPVQAGDEWWGFFGYDDCAEPRRWSPIELHALKAVAAILGSAIHRQRVDAQARGWDIMMRAHLESLPLMTYMEYNDDESEFGYTDLHVSPQVEQILGYTVDEWLHDFTVQKWSGSIHPDDRAWVLEITDGATQTGESYEIEYRVRRKDGRWIWVRDECHLGEASEGMRPYWHGIMMDITAFKGSEEKLRAAEEQFHSLVDNVPGVVYLDPVDPNNPEIYISPKIIEILGMTRDEWLAADEDWIELVHPDDRDKAYDGYEDFVAKGSPPKTEYRIVRKDGRVLWLGEETKVLNDAQGRPHMMEGLIRDITEEKAAEEAREFQAQLLQNMSDAVIAYDPGGTIISWNRAAQVIYGWPAEDVIGKPLPEGLRYDPEMLDKGDLWDPFIEEMGGWVGRPTQRDRDGFELRIETRGVPLHAADGSLRGYVMVNREVSST